MSRWGGVAALVGVVALPQPSKSYLVRLSAGPSSAQRFVELDDGHQVEAPGRRKRELRVEEIPPGCEYIQIVGEPTLVAQPGEMQGRSERSDLGFLRLGLLSGRACRDECIFNFPEGHEDSLLVLGQGLSGLR